MSHVHMKYYTYRVTKELHKGVLIYSISLRICDVA